MMTVKTAYKRNQAGQFVDGTAPGPGRPKSKPITDALLANLDPEAFAQKLIVLAMKGDIRAICEIIDRIEGKAVQSMDVGGDIATALTQIAERYGRNGTSPS